MVNETEEITTEKMDELIKNPYQLLEERVIELEAERDEINNKLETVAQILYAIRTQWATVIPEPPTPEAEKETEGGPE